jgi:16S rRNA (guanine527-N7)-methyltransferase
MLLSTDEQRRLERDAQRLGSDLSSAQVSALGNYLELLFLWRVHARLISRHQTRTDVLTRHIADALAVVRHLRGRRRVVDLGSGAGFPGIPIAIAAPALAVTLIESMARKARFLLEVVRQLRLANVEVVNDRVERHVPTEPYEAATSRAVWRLSEFVSAAYPLVRADGVLIAMKGPRVDAELRSLHAMEPQLGTEVVAYELEPKIVRSLVLIRRVCST